jgi:hypothetical protein
MFHKVRLVLSLAKLMFADTIIHSTTRAAGNVCVYSIESSGKVKIFDKKCS